MLDGLAAAKEAGLTPVKVNAVLDPATGREDVVGLLRFCLEHGYQLRVIEQMPLDAGHQWRRDAALCADDVLAALRPHFRLRPDPAPRGSAPAELWLVDTGPGTPAESLVSSRRCRTPSARRVTAPGLTADGQIRSSCSPTKETDLRGLLRSGAPDDAIEAAWRTAMWGKPAGHGINDPTSSSPIAR